MIGHLITQGIKLGAVVTVAEATAPVIKRGVHKAARYVADATGDASDIAVMSSEEE